MPMSRSIIAYKVKEPAKLMGFPGHLPLDKLKLNRSSQNEDYVCLFLEIFTLVTIHLNSSMDVPFLSKQLFGFVYWLINWK